MRYNGFQSPVYIWAIFWITNLVTKLEHINHEYARLYFKEKFVEK